MNFFPVPVEKNSNAGTIMSRVIRLTASFCLMLMLVGQVFANVPKPSPASPPPTCPTILIDGSPNGWPEALNNPSLTKKAFRHDAFQANGIDDQWTGGSQDNDQNISTDWKWVLGNSNDKGDIANAGLFICDGVLYFFGDRAAYNGDAQIGLWLFVDNVYPSGTGIRASGFNGQHQNGDLLIISNFTNGGGVSAPNIYVWKNGGLVPITSPVGMLATNSGSVPPPTPPGNYSIPMYNGESWYFKAKNTAPNDYNYLTNLFFEGMVDLNQVSALVNLPLANACYQRFMLETRNSQSLGASLQDLVAGVFSGLPASPQVINDTICVNETNPVLSAICSGSGTVNWYETASSTTSIFTGSNFTPSGPYSVGTRTYYASCTEGNCESPRVAVRLVVSGLPVVDATASPSAATLVSIGMAAPHYSLSTSVDGVPSNTNYNYSWVQDPATGGSLSSTTIPNPTFTATVSGSYMWIVTATSKFPPYCSSMDTVIRELGPVAPCPSLDYTSDCGLTTQTYTASVAPASYETWAWSVNNGAVINGANNLQSVSVTSGVSAFTLTLTKTYANTLLAPQVCTYNIDVISCGGHIFPTNTTCCNYLGGPTLTFDLEQVCTTVSGGKVTNAIPGVFFYFGDFTAATTGPVTINVRQARNSAALCPFDPQNNSNVRVYVDNCVTVTPSSVSIGSGPNKGNASITFNAIAGKRYIISVKYDVKSLVNCTAPAGPVVYSFAMYLGSSITPIAATTGTLNVVQGCTDNTPPASGSCPSPKGMISNSEEPPAIVRELAVSAYPNPYRSAVNFRVTSPEAGDAVLEVFDATGRRLTSMIKRNVSAGMTEEIRYLVPGSVKTNLFYKLTVNDKSVKGSVISER